MAKAPLSKSKRGRRPQLIDDPKKLLSAIMKAVGSLKTGESLELRRVSNPKHAKKQSPKRKTAPGKRKTPRPPA